MCRRLTRKQTKIPLSQKDKKWWVSVHSVRLSSNTTPSDAFCTGTEIQFHRYRNTIAVRIRIRICIQKFWRIFCFLIFSPVFDYIWSSLRACWYSEGVNLNCKLLLTYIQQQYKKSSQATKLAADRSDETKSDTYQKQILDRRKLCEQISIVVLVKRCFWAPVGIMDDCSYQAALRAFFFELELSGFHTGSAMYTIE